MPPIPKWDNEIRSWYIVRENGFKDFLAFNQAHVFFAASIANSLELMAKHPLMQVINNYHDKDDSK
jgi:pterin-4a-carbinolamine dehydratase